MGVRFVERFPDRPAGGADDGVVILCPWLKGLPPETGLWASALPIHDVNDFVDGAFRLEECANDESPLYVGVFALDRFRSPPRLLAQLQAKGVRCIVNLPSVSFFDGRWASILESLGLGHEQELAFLRQAKRIGFRVALCTRRDRLGSVPEIGMFDAVLCHDGPGSAFTFLNQQVAPAY